MRQVDDRLGASVENRVSASAQAEGTAREGGRVLCRVENPGKAFESNLGPTVLQFQLGGEHQPAGLVGLGGKVHLQGFAA